ncbi:MAG: histidine kinase N-terminal 7TM domain-containing protein, partial [Thermoflexus sp.]
MAILGGLLGLASLILAYTGWRRVRTPEARSWALGLIAMAWWTLSESGAIASADPIWRAWWLRVQVLGVAGVAPWLLLGALQYSGTVPVVRLRHWIAIFLLPVLTVLLAFTNDLHHLVWSMWGVRPDGTLTLTYGPWFWVHTLFAIMVFLIALVLMVPIFARAYRTLLLVIVGLSMTTALVFASLFLRLHDPSYTHLPMEWQASTAAMLGLATALLGLTFQIFPRYPIPITTSLILQGIPDGILVLDLWGRIADVNPQMARWLGRSVSSLIGASAEEILAPWPELQQALRSWMREGQGGTGEFRQPEQERWFLVSAQPIQRDGKPIGWLVRANEITDYKRQSIRRAKQQEALVRLATDPQVQSGDVETAMARIAWAAAETLEVSRVNIWRLDERNDRLECLVHVEWPAGVFQKGEVLRAADY